MMEENGSAFVKNNNYSPTSPTGHCISINKVNLFEIPNSSNNEHLFATKSVENEGEFIFNSDRTSDFYYNYRDAKELEYQFNQIQKKITN